VITLSEKIIDLKKEIEKYKFDNYLLQKIEILGDERKRLLKLSDAQLPEGVIREEGVFEGVECFYRIHQPDLTKEELEEYRKLKQLDHLRSIKNSMKFFVTLTVISLIAQFLVGLYVLSNIK